MKKKVLMVFGTRPEAIKMAPVYHELRSRPDEFDFSLCVTAQHREMLDQVLDAFDVKPDFDLDIMRPNQGLPELTGRVLLEMTKVLEKVRPDWVLVHGDTTTSFVAALGAFYAKVRVGHVEAGLRTGRLDSPWPEEANRQLTGRLTNLHFAPTESARQNLLKENVDDSKIVVTGNTVVDAVMWMKSRLESKPELQEKVQSQVAEASRYLPGKPGRRLILVTGHRRENFGHGLEQVCFGLRDVASKYPDVDILYPVHLNPNVQTPVRDILGNLPNLFLAQPLEYAPFVYLMKLAEIIVTDSGGIQEEAPSLGTPVLLTRDTTERPEAIELGVVKMIGPNRQKLMDTVSTLLDSREKYDEMVTDQNPYGDGHAARRIADRLAGESQ